VNYAAKPASKGAGEFKLFVCNRESSSSRSSHLYRYNGRVIFQLRMARKSAHVVKQGLGRGLGIGEVLFNTSKSVLFAMGIPSFRYSE
jgi:hypothetical protein